MLRVTISSMGKARPRLKRMPQKLLLIREHLNVSQPVMAQLLELPKKGHVSEYENGVRVPNLMVTLAYSRLGKVSMESVVDDEVNVNEFCEQLGKAELSITTQDSQRKCRNKRRNKATPLIRGGR